MTSILKAGAFIIWLIVATPLFAIIWSRNLDYFPDLPEWVGIFIAQITGLADKDDTETLTVYYMLIVSLVEVSIITAVAWLIWRLCRRGK